jgi:filamentous hemagglutinin
VSNAARLKEAIWTFGPVGVVAAIGKLNRFGKLVKAATNNAPKGGFGAGGLWNTIDEVVDPAVVRQLNGGSCGPSCGAMLLRATGNPAAQSAIALRQGAVMSDNASRLAGAMNDLAGTPGIWKGGFIDVFTNPTGTFGVLSRNGSFATTLRTPAMKVSHMVVVDGLDDVGRVLIRDPAGVTRYLMNWDDFIKVWEGQSVYR